MHTYLDADVVQAWAHNSVELLGRERAEIDALNVFPVPDGDTGTNLYLTLEAAAEALDSSSATAGSADAGTDAALCEAVDSFARGALLGARGNSGVITSQLLRGFADAICDAEPGSPRDGHALAAALACASESAYSAVAVPREGTVLSVARGAAEGAALAGSDLAEVAQVALASAREALARTPDQLPVLRDAGVVDAGGQGLVVLLEALYDAVSDTTRSPRKPGPTVRPTAHTPVPGYTGPEYEVMYLLDAPDDAAATLRSQLNDLGDSVVVVGGRGLWNVHVHADDVGAAVERGVEAGSPHRIRVTRLLEADSLRSQGRGEMHERALVVVAHGDPMAEYLEAAGATIVRARPRGRPSTSELLDGARRAASHDIVFLPSDSDTLPVAEAAASAARDLGLRASVVPTRSVVQSLAAVAVHDPDARFDDDVIAMGRAAGATRYGAVTVAAREAITSAGTCHPGDVLGLVDGDIAVIGADVAEVAGSVADRLIGGRTELLTIVSGKDATPALIDSLRASASADRPYLEVEVIDGGQESWPLILGAE